MSTDNGLTYLNYDANMGASEEEEDSGGVADWVYPTAAVGAFFALLTIICFVTAYIVRKSKMRVGSNAKSAPVLQKKTTHQLMEDIAQKSKARDEKAREKWKQRERPPHPKPNTPGPNVTIITRGNATPHPPPAPPMATNDPVYPPLYLHTFPDGSAPPPPAPFLGPSAPPMQPMQNWGNTVPQSFTYLSPMEARDMGIYGN